MQSKGAGTSRFWKVMSSKDPDLGMEGGGQGRGAAGVCVCIHLSVGRSWGRKEHPGISSSLSVRTGAGRLCPSWERKGSTTLQ